MRFLAEENFDNDILRGVLSKCADFDYVRVQDTEIYQADDAAMLAWAAKEWHTLLTCPIKYAHLASEMPPHDQRFHFLFSYRLRIRA